LQKVEKKDFAAAQKRRGAPPPWAKPWAELNSLNFFLPPITGISMRAQQSLSYSVGGNGSDAFQKKKTMAPKYTPAIQIIKGKKRQALERKTRKQKEQSRGFIGRRKEGNSTYKQN